MYNDLPHELESSVWLPDLLIFCRFLSSMLRKIRQIIFLILVEPYSGVLLIHLKPRKRHKYEVFLKSLKTEWVTNSNVKTHVKGEKLKVFWIIQERSLYSYSCSGRWWRWSNWGSWSWWRWSRRRFNEWYPTVYAIYEK